MSRITPSVDEWSGDRGDIWDDPLLGISGGVDDQPRGKYTGDRMFAFLCLFATAAPSTVVNASAGLV
jgi:hypothetical protein